MNNILVEKKWRQLLERLDENSPDSYWDEIEEFFVVNFIVKNMVSFEIEEDLVSYSMKNGATYVWRQAFLDIIRKLTSQYIDCGSSVAGFSGCSALMTYFGKPMDNINFHSDFVDYFLLLKAFKENSKLIKAIKNINFDCELSKQYDVEQSLTTTISGLTAWVEKEYGDDINILKAISQKLCYDINLKIKPV